MFRFVAFRVAAILGSSLVPFDSSTISTSKVYTHTYNLIHTLQNQEEESSLNLFTLFLFLRVVSGWALLGSVCGAASRIGAGFGRNSGGLPFGFVLLLLVCFGVGLAVDSVTGFPAGFGLLLDL